MRPSSLTIVLLAVVGCTVRTPRPGELGIRVNVAARIDARVHAPPPPVQPVVALQGAPVAEFFGIPLEGVNDVLFVLDVSGSMAGPAQGRLAEIVITTPPPVDAPPPPPPPDPVRPDSTPGDSTPPDSIAPDSTRPGYPPPPPPPPDPVRPDSTPPDSTPRDSTAPDTSPPGEPPPPGPPPEEVATTRVVQARKIDVAKAELVDALSRLAPGTRVNVLFFSDDVDGFAPSPVTIDDETRANLIAFVQTWEPLDDTALAPALRIAFLMNASRIVLLSDGLGNVGGGPEQILRDAREAVRGGARIDTIGIGGDQDGALLGTLARESNGLYQSL